MKQGWGATVVNGSLLPVYDVKVAFHREDGRHLATTEHGVLPPGEEFVPYPGPLNRDHPGVVGNEDSLRVEVEFRDTAGRVWLRDRYGTLSLVKKNAYIRVAGVIPAPTMNVQLRVEDDGAEPGRSDP